ncbi:hypothetical protein C2S52_023431 [Perilla frutescens var. hirtella]|nr:hypothetical protein C2S52_023431 [Perilla frutescens var. hirtella]
MQKYLKIEENGSCSFHMLICSFIFGDDALNVSGALVSCRGHLAWLDHIRENLGMENLHELEKSCFGKFLAVPAIQFQGQLFNVLIRKLDKSSLGKLRLCFCINDSEVVFGPAEFALITGLNFKRGRDPPNESEFHEVVFHGAEDLVFYDIHKAFIKECKAITGKSQNSLKLSLLYILYGILLIRDRKWKRFDLKYMHLVDDISNFNHFHWGEVAYEFLMRSTHHSRELLENKLAGHKSLALDVNGFSLALQIWAYEVMLNIASECATVVPTLACSIPRILRWSAANHVRFEKVQTLFMQSKNGPLVMSMEPNESEKIVLEELGVHTVCAGVVGVGSEADDDTRSSSLKGPHSGLYRCSKRRRRDPHCHCFDRGIITPAVTPLVGVDVSESDIVEVPSAAPDELGSLIAAKQFNCATVISGLGSPGALHWDVSIDVRPGGYDPCEMSYDQRRVHAYQVWRENALQQQPPAQLKLPGKICADVEWLDCIWDPVHCEYSSPHWAPILSFCWGHLTNNTDFSGIADKLMPYVRGDFPRGAGRA